MAPRGITVHPGLAIDFSALARPAPKPSNSILSRATSSRTSVSGYIFLIILVLIAAALVFAVVVLSLIWKNKRQRQKRQRQMDAAQLAAAKHEYGVLQDAEGESGRLHELPQDSEVRDTVPFRTVELQADVNEVPGVQQLEGYTAQARFDDRPAELPSESHAVDTQPHR